MAGFLGGALASGTYYLYERRSLRRDVRGADAGGSSSTPRRTTLGDAAIVGTTTTYVSHTTTLSATIISGAPSMRRRLATMWNYLVTGTGTGSTLSLNAVSSSDVKVFTKR